MKTIRVVLVEIMNHNLGDSVIADTTAFLLRRISSRPFAPKIRMIPYNIYRHDPALLARADLIVFAGGGLIKFRCEHFYELVPPILQVAQEYNIPVFFNAVGVEGYDGENENCRMLADALNLPVVKGFSIRDDAATLQRYYLKTGEKRVQTVSDPAVWAAQCYERKKRKDASIIGLGIVRHRIFADYGTPSIDRTFLLEFWKEVIHGLEQRNLPWKLFTNGVSSDEEFAREILEECGMAEQAKTRMVPRPVEAKELVETISGFRAIIAGRMHANIVAYSLGIPSIGLVWNPKLQFWGEKIGHPERFLPPRELSAQRALQQLDVALQEKETGPSRTQKQGVLDELEHFIRTYSRKEEQAKIRRPSSAFSTPWSGRLMATALGGKSVLYHNMNSPVTIKEAYEKGFRFFEADIRPTSDGELVCVNGWNEATYRRLGITPPENPKKGLSRSEFLAQRYFGKYPPCDFVRLASEIARYPQARWMLDIGLPSDSNRKRIFTQLIRLLPADLNQRVIVRLQREKDVEKFREQNLPYAIAYYIPPDCTEEELTARLSFCKAQKISLVTLAFSAFSAEIGARVHQAGMRSCLFSCDSLTQAEEAFKKGADLISTHDLSPIVLDWLYGI